jgi:hypothetical protein
MRAFILARNREKPRNRYGATPVRRIPAAARYVYTRRIYATIRYAAYGPANPTDVWQRARLKQFRSSFVSHDSFGRGRRIAVRS